MPKTPKKVYFVTGGGTGGHIYPAMAVADALHKEGKVYYVGNRRKMEAELVAKKKYKFLHISITGMPRKLDPNFFFWGVRLVKAVLKSIRYIKKYKPSAVFATGGYVSAPMIMACIITKTPYMMHDCDAMPGLVTRKLSGRAKYVSLAFERAKKFLFNKKTIVSGNPIRSEFETLNKEDARANMGLEPQKLTLCVMGGSQGAQTINNAVAEIIKELIQDKGLQVIFQTGKKNYDSIIEKLKLVYPGFEQEKSFIIKPYFDDMISVLKSSDIVISRAGSLSISEICASGAAPILVPYPHAAANHQRINAKCLLDLGACVYVEDAELEPNKLREVLLTLLDNPVKMNYLKQNALHLAKYNATDVIVEHIRKLSKIG